MIMEDNFSDNSDSLTTSGEYEIVSETPSLVALTSVKSSATNTAGTEKNSISPTLNIANNGDFIDLKNDMTEVIKELDKIPDSKKSSKTLTLPLATISKYSTQQITPSPLFCDATTSDLSTPSLSTNRVGHSVFYDCVELLSPGELKIPDDGIKNTTDFEKQDKMKSEKLDFNEEISDADKGTTFSGIIYLGSRVINAPKSEQEIQRKMTELNMESEQNGWKCTVSIPNTHEGCVILRHAETDEIEESCEINRILYYARGMVINNTQACFAFTWSHGEERSSIFKCYVFRCHIPEAVNQVSNCFSKAFQRYPPSLTGSITSVVGENTNLMTSSVTSDQSGNPIMTASYDFVVALAIGEKIEKGTYSPVPRDRACFKLRCNTDKEICVTVKQTPSTILNPLYIERCFGVLLSPGKLVRQADMQLLNMTSMGYQKPIGGAQQNTVFPNPLQPYLIRAEWESSEKGLEQFNCEAQRMFLTVAVDLVIKGIQEPVRFVIETQVAIQSQNDFRIMDHFISKRSMQMRFYLQLKKTEENMWEVNSIDPSEEINDQSSTQSSSILKSINNLSKMVRSSSIVSIEDDDCPTDYSSDGNDEPLLSGTGEVSKDCSPDTLDEWNTVLKEWNENEKRPKSLPALVRVGIPEALRGRIWQKLTNVENKTDMTDMYRTLITKETKCEAVILRDISRTFPAHKIFKSGEGQDALFKVSKAYAVYDTEVGYCQGLSFIAASLLIHMPEEEAFCILVALMYDENYGLRELYKQGFESLYLRLYQLDRLIKEHLPKLHEHFTDCGVETHMYASQWFLTIFTARFPLYFVFHVLDVFMLDGFTILFQVAITLLSICESDLRQLDFEGILKYFRVSLPKKCRSPKEARRIMKMACERKIRKLKQYEEEFFVNRRNEERLAKEQRAYQERFSSERDNYKKQIKELQTKLDESKSKLDVEEQRRCNIVTDYKKIIQRQEQEISKFNTKIEDLTKSISSCKSCSEKNLSDPESYLTSNKLQDIGNNKQSSGTLGPLDPLIMAQQRIRELELELAQAKLAQVEAECKNQDLNHQLTTTLTEIQNNSSRNSWQPWLSKTLNSIQEKVSTKRDIQPTFQSYTQDGVVQEKSLQETSPKINFKLQNNQRNLANRRSIDVLPKDQTILRET